MKINELLKSIAKIIIILMIILTIELYTQFYMLKIKL